MSEFRLNPKQAQAQQILAGDATHLMLFGGSRSGKTFLLTRNVVMRALKAPNSRHVALRFRFNAIKASIVMDTFPKVMKVAFPGVEYSLSKTDWFVEFANGSQFWFGGLDDKERTEKILGQEFATIYLNECSQIPWGSVGIAVTRLAQKAEQQIEGRQPTALKPRMYYDCNPPSKAHWTYKVFVEKRDPETKESLVKPHDYAHFQINPQDNAENLSENYLETLKSLSGRLQKRFLLGEFGDATSNALFAEENIDKWRQQGGELPDMVRIVVAVDPSGSDDQDNADNDAIGIVVAGLGTDGNAYVLEDCTVKAGPATWGNVVTSAYERHDADVVVGETNFGGAMVEHVIKTCRARTPYKQVTASRGKAVRAEPFSALYEQGKVRHVGRFNELEDELTAFTTTGYVGANSPNRADALIWALTELFPGLTRAKREKKEPKLNNSHIAGSLGWMG
ncbi:MAG: phage terminase large subunit [Bacillota bacterium]